MSEQSSLEVHGSQVKNPNQLNNLHQWAIELGGAASLESFTKKDKLFFVVAGEHFSRQAGEFFLNEITSQITQPEDWLFLIEGPDSGVYECKIAKNIATEKQIPIEDPILDPFQAEVIERYLQSSELDKLPKEIVYGSLCATLANARNTSDLRELAIFLDVADPTELLQWTLLTLEEKNRNPDHYKANIKKLHESLLQISNALSAQLLDYYVRQNPNKNHIAVYLGKNHRPIITSDLTQIPESLKLNDDEITTLNTNRKLRTIRRIMRTLDLNPNPREAVQSLTSPSQEVKTVIEKWADNLFNLKYVQQKGYQHYLDSDSSLHQIWGAAAFLQTKVELAKNQKRAVTAEELAEANTLFQRAIDKRRSDGGSFVEDANELTVIQANLPTLIEMMKKTV